MGPNLRAAGRTSQGDAPLARPCSEPSRQGECSTVAKITPTRLAGSGRANALLKLRSTPSRKSFLVRSRRRLGLTGHVCWAGAARIMRTRRSLLCCTWNSLGLVRLAIGARIPTPRARWCATAGQLLRIQLVGNVVVGGAPARHAMGRVMPAMMRHMMAHPRVR